jgi:hypothetical protein
MVVMNEYADQRDRANREELAARIACIMREEGVSEPIQGLHLHRRAQPNERIHSVTEPSFCVIAQGRK